MPGEIAGPAFRLRAAGRRVPPHVRFLVGHALIGIAVGVLFVAAILALDIAGLKGLILRGADGALALGLLLFGVSVTFGSAAMGAAVMGLGAPARPRPWSPLRWRRLRGQNLLARGYTGGRRGTTPIQSRAARANVRSTFSHWGLTTICIPTGRPEAVKPQGRLHAGWPVRLNG
jgi:hypothetical protein